MAVDQGAGDAVYYDRATVSEAHTVFVRFAVKSARYLKDERVDRWVQRDEGPFWRNERALVDYRSERCHGQSV